MARRAAALGGLQLCQIFPHVLVAAMRLAATLIAAWSTVGVMPAAAVPLSSEEEAGRAIYQNGESAFGDAFSGKLGIAQQEVPGSAVRCANCHGPDGLGRPEGGVRPSIITWSELTKPYGHAHDDGRRHPPYDPASLKRSLVEGVDPADNALDGVMPRYVISDRDFKALVAYLKKLESQRDPGIGADALRLGTLLPAAGRFGDMGQAVRGILQAYFAGINRDGGIYGRKLELVVAEYPEDRAAALRELRKLTTGGQVFALLSPMAAGFEDELGQLANEAKIPVIGPLSLFGDNPQVLNQQVFHLLSGVGELAQVLAQHVARDPKRKTRPAVLLHPASYSGEGVAEAVAAQLKTRGWTGLSRISFQPGAFDANFVAKLLRARGAESVFLLGPGAELGALANALVPLGPAPLLLLPGPLVQRTVLDLPHAFADRVLLAYPTIPSDQKPDALRDYAALFREHNLARGHQTLQVPAYSSAVLLVEVLKRAGRDLTRQKFLTALESVRDFETGLLPKLTFDAQRRLGATGGYVVGVDLQSKNFRPLGGFVQLQ